MSRNSISWLGSISETLWDKGPVSFTRRRLLRQDHLFAHRAALFYTPTENIPLEHIGTEPLDITLPVVPPDWTGFLEIPAYRTPRFWVDLLQRQTCKLRWRPISPARVTFVRYDCQTIRSDHLCAGMKALRDALKVRTTGRRDGSYLHYFGAIVDDGNRFATVSYSQRLVIHAKDARVRIRVQPLKK